ncbi:MAG: elongation factor P [Ignavibacteria bacterium]|nr:elongation factor P [Ignavibacteria bacterium]
MVLASDAKAGMVIQIEEKIFKVLEVNRHAGSGQMQGFIGLKLKDIRFGHLTEKRFKHGDKLNEIELTKRQMDYLYADADSSYFMDSVTFEQVSVPLATLGTQQQYLTEGMKVTIEMLGGEPVSLDFPKVVELEVIATGPGIRGGQDNTLKPATLSNGLEILVPQFIETGERVRVDTEKNKYIDRVLSKKI